MTWYSLLAMLVWTAAGAVLLFILMGIDTLFTKYKDMEEIKRGNIAVTSRFVMKLIAQGYILSRSIATSNALWEALIVSIVSFGILLFVEWCARIILKLTVKIDLDEATQQGKMAAALLAGSLHIVGALIIAATL